ARVFRDVQRQRPVGTEEAGEPLLERGRLAVARFARRQGRRREGNRSLLRQAHRLIRRAQGFPELRPVGEEIFDSPQGLEEVELPGRPCERLEQRYTSWRAAIRGGHRLISPRRSDTRTSSVNSRNAVAPCSSSRSATVR